MSMLAPTLQAFFTDRLTRQRNASPHTIAAYRDTQRLLLAFAQKRTGKQPCQLDLDDLDAPLIGAFLDHLEHERHNSIRTRNARLAAIRSLFHYAALEHPEHAETISRVLAIPPKHFERALITFLVEPEIDALLAAPDRDTWTGRRDHAMLLLAVQTGLRASELTALKCSDIHLGAGPHVSCLGKGRKHRVTPLTKQTVAVLLHRASRTPGPPRVPTRTGRAPSSDALQRRLAEHTTTAALACPSMATKTISPHVLRHTAAMQLLHAGIDTSVIALWLGHEHVETTQIYLHADTALKEAALARTTPPDTPPGRYQPPDTLLAFLETP